jgi:myosin heavy chain 9/10/11/14
MVRDLQQQLERKEKAQAQLQDEVQRSKDKVERLLRTVEELQSSDSSNQLSAKRAERELKEEKEKSLRLERELEGWKDMSMRMDRSHMSRHQSVMTIKSGLDSELKKDRLDAKDQDMKTFL